MIKKNRRFNWALAAVLALILVLSVAFIQSASFDSSTGQARPYAFKQAIWIALGITVFFVVRAIDLRTIHRWTPMIYLICIVLLISVFVVGEVNKGARRWISLGFADFQPSEVMKLAVILAVSRFLSTNRDGVGAPFNGLLMVLLPIVIMLVPVALILKQPDLGTSLVFFPVVFAMIWMSGAKKRWIFLMIALACIAAPLAWKFMLKDYQKGRLVVFLDPENPKRILEKVVSAEAAKRMRSIDSYHYIQSQIAVGSGGLTGKGYGMGTQNTLGYLPEKHTDFIFGVVAEEWGFIGAASLILLFFVLVLIIFDVSLVSQWSFGKLIVIGIGTLIFTHVAINTAMTVGLAPITGLTLPFLSYGGSSVVTFFIAMGLVANVYKYDDSLTNASF